MNALAVARLVEWNWCFHSDGKDPNWPTCKFLCQHHDMDDASREYHLKNKYCKEDHFDYCASHCHWICKVLCGCHYPRGHVGTIKLGKKSRISPGRMAQHFVEKCKKNDLKRPLRIFRYVKCICIVFVV